MTPGHLLDALVWALLIIMALAGSGALYLVRMPDTGRHLKPRRGLVSRPDEGAGPAPAPAGSAPPPVPAREVAESARGLGSLEKTPAAGAAPVISETGAVPPHPRYGPLAVTPAAGIGAVRQDGVIICGGRNLGTQPRRTLPTRPTRPGHPPWDTAAQPAGPAPEPAGPDPTPGDELGEPIGPARPYAPQCDGEAPVLDADEAQRLAEAMIA